MPSLPTPSNGTLAAAVTCAWRFAHLLTMVMIHPIIMMTTSACWKEVASELLDDFTDDAPYDAAQTR